MLWYTALIENAGTQRVYASSFVEATEYFARVWGDSMVIEVRAS